MTKEPEAALVASLCPDCEAPMRCTGTRTWWEDEWERTERTYVCDNHGVTSSTARHVGPTAPLARQVRYVCGQCGLDTRCTVPETTAHWLACVALARATGVRLPEPTLCQREDEDGPCIVQAESCTCRVPFGCAEDYPGCCFCVHMDVYHPCPTFGFGCGPGCDCCTPHQQRQVFRQAQPRPLSKPEDYYEPDPFADDDAQQRARPVGDTPEDSHNR